MHISKALFRLLLGRRLPTTRGDLTAPGARDRVLIRRDRYGIPYVEARNDEDVWYALGFCQGQDRAFALQTLLRAARGELAELLGPGALPSDRLSRRLDFAGLAPRQLAAMLPEHQRRFAAFARGINDGGALGNRRKPHELTLLRASPLAFDAQDVVSIYLLQCMALSSNWDIELARLRIIEQDGAEALRLLERGYPPAHPASVPPGQEAGAAVDALEGDLRTLAGIVGMGRASNSWALAPAKTSTGRPLVASDPHLTPGVPSHWYLAHARTPDWGLAGAMFAGLPAFAVGHNGHVAWGLTLGLVDNSDLFIERLGPDGGSVWDGERFAACEVVERVINVRGQKPERERSLVTPRGPVVARSPSDESVALSLQATWLRALPIEGLLQTHRSTSCEDFRRLFAEWPHISLNLTYADVHGDIGYQLAGAAPRRRGGAGMAPMPAWREDAGWLEDFVPFNDMPHASNPPGGFVATANNRPTTNDRDPFLGADWLDGYRASRIMELLAARDDWDIGSTARAQTDAASLPWRELRQPTLSAPASTDQAALAQRTLAEWDGVVGADSTAAAVFEFFLAEMLRRVAMCKAPRSWEWVIGRGDSPIHSLTLLAGRRVGHLASLLNDTPPEWDDIPFDDLIDRSLDAAVGALRERFGDDPRAWRWGRVRPLTFRHLFGRRRLLAPIFNLPPCAIDGDTNTVLQAGVDPRDPAANPLVCPSLRMVVDVGDWDDNLFSLPGGQSGNPLSPHYSDLFPLWKQGTGTPIAWTRSAVRDAAASVLTLHPSPRR